jgi:polyhydroxybutyrate depolymerase
MRLRTAAAFLALASCSTTSTTPPDGAVDMNDAASPDVGTADDATGDAYMADPLIAARPYAFKAPADYDPSKKTPLVIMLHGYSASGAVEESYVKFGSVQKSFLYAYPDGLKDPSGKRFWNADDACCNFANNPVDDVAYIDAIIEDVAKQYNLDRQRVFVFGHSNGGFMAHRLACDLSPKIAAIAALAGDVWNDPTKCKPAQPVSVLQIHGTADMTILYDGGAINNIPYPSATTSVATWAAKNGCGNMLVDTMMPIDLESSLGGPETTVLRHACTMGAAELWSITGGTHVPALQPTFATQVYAFFEAHPKP